MNNENNGGESLTPEQIELIIKERDEALLAKKGMTEELIAERKKKQEALALAESLKKSEEPQTDVEKLIEAKLKEREDVEARFAADQAWNEFVADNKEFAPESDTTGLRAEALKREFNRFNLTGAKKKEEFLSALRDAKRLLKNEDKRDNENPYASAPRSGTTPIVTDEASLSSAERATMKRLGWTLQKFNEQKLKHPELFSSVFN
jgi:hypothetical protein